MNRKALKCWPALAIILIILFAWYVSANWFQLMLIQGESMAPAYHNLQIVILNKHDKAYERGDVIAFQCEGLSAVLVKRVVGIPEDHIRISDGQLYVNDVLSGQYADAEFEFAGLLEHEIILGEGEYIVIGDNIAESKDSRYEAVGVVDEKDIMGRVQQLFLTCQVK